MNSKNPILTHISELNTEFAEGSHNSVSEYSHLVPDFRSLTDLDSSITNAADPCYVRIKQLPDRSFFMMYNEKINGDGIRMLKSKNGRDWEEYSTVFHPTEKKKYANPEAIILQNGDILACAAWRIAPEYLTDNTMGGIETVRSADGGKTWSEPQLVHTGLTWEPYFLQLRSGEIQLYWTNTTRYNLPNGNNTSTGTAMLRSFDNGYSWSGDPKKPYDAQIVSQQPTEFYDGVQFYTDQMPVARELQNGTIILGLECRRDRKGTCDLSLSYSTDNWATAIPVDGEGPEDKNKNMYHGGGPYVDQFASGETVFKYQQWRLYNIRLGDPTGRDFSAPPVKLSKMVNFSGFEKLKDEHSILCSGSVAYPAEDGKEHYFIRLHTVRLNHALHCPKGMGKEWEENRDALFVGSVSRAQASYRFAKSEKGLRLRIDRIDDSLTEEDTCTVRFSLPEGNENYLQFTVSPYGITESFTVKNGIKEEAESSCSVTVCAAKNSSEYNGYIAEAEICGCFEDVLRVLPSLVNKDEDGEAVTDIHPEADTQNTEKWIPIFFDK